MSAVRAGALELPKLAAFLRRDFLLALSYRTVFVTDVLQLCSQIVMFALVGALIEPSALPEYGGEQTTYLKFVAVGTVVTFVSGILLSRVSSAIRNEQMIGTLEAVLVTPTRLRTVQIGSVAFDAVQVPLRMGVFLAGVTLAFGLDLQLSGIAPSVLVLVVLAPFVWGIGLVGGAAALTFRRGASMTGLAGLALGLGSGAYFPLSVLPGWLEAIARWNPLALAIDAIRDALIGGAGWSVISGDLALLAALALASLAGGVLAFRAAVARERRLGTLGLY